MVIILAREENLPLINIVRKEEQVKLLKDMGAEHVLNSSDEGFWD
jgi:NADPH2:quinone reductase